MPRIDNVAITLASACGLLLLGCQPNTTQSEPPAEENTMPGQTQPTAVYDEPTERPLGDEDVTQEEQPGDEMTDRPQNEKVSAQGQTFVDEAAQSGMAEVELSKVVVEKAKKDEIKQFAQRMIDDHGKINEDLTTLANQIGATVPSEMAEPAKKKQEELKKLSGKKLETRYMKIMVEDHQKAVELFEKQAQRDEDPKLQEFAARNLPTLQEHFEHAKAVQEGRPRTGPQAKAPKADADGGGEVAAKP